jgi:hypothetical protein
VSYEFGIDRDSPKVFEQSITPAIQVTLRYRLSQEMVPVNINGSVYTDDNKFISVLTELPPVDTRDRIYGGEEMEPSTILSRLGTESNELVQYQPIDLIFTLNKKALDYVEERRYMTNRKDVTFRFHLKFTMLRTSIRAGPFKSHNLEQNKLAVILSSGNSTTESDLDFNILVSPHNTKHHDSLLTSRVIHKNTSITIPSSTWVNDFQEKLGLGKFMVIEIPQLKTDLKGINDASLGDDQRQLKERLFRALENLNEIEDNIKKAEWKKTAQGCRDTIEPLTKGNIPRLIREMIIQTTGIEDKSANLLTVGLENIFGYSSGLHHQINKDQTIATQYVGGKEDAYMNYMILAAIINTVARKFIATLKT